MKTLTTKIPPGLAAQLEGAARERGASKSTLVREALAAYLGTDPVGGGHPGSFLTEAGDLAGSVAGPRDLSTGAKHLRGYGR